MLLCMRNDKCGYFLRVSGIGFQKATPCALASNQGQLLRCARVLHASRMAKALLVLALALLCIQHVRAQAYSLQGSSVKILFPPGYRTNVMNMVMADFGRAEYGASLIGKLVYPSEDPAYNPNGKAYRCPTARCEYGCDPFEAAQPPFAVSKKPGEFIIMLLDRGPQDISRPCYFLSKAYNAQLAGADAVLIADDSDTEVTTAIVPDKEEVAHLLSDLTVSLGLIAKKDGVLLKGLLKDQATVTVALNWTNLEPRRSKVSWEFWTTSNDQCGTLCKEQANFITGMKALSRSLTQQNLTDFSPHYLLWSCPVQYAGSDECQNECIMNGTYCSPDPDGNQSQGYKGSDVLAMNVRHLCYFRLAKEAGSPWLWWDFADKFHQTCKSSTLNFTATCAQEVFRQVNGPMLLNGQGQAKWDACIANGTAPIAGQNITRLPLLEEELALQQGDAQTAAVSILPTIRVNGKQFRGTLDVKGVARALCSAFPLGEEPSICNDKSISEDECEPWAVGHKNCRVGDPAAGGRTRCVNTFSGYKCECGQGWVRSSKADTGEEVCEDLNECLATNVALTDPQCGCDRCACINLIGSYKCTGPLANKCTPEYNYGGCWKGPWDSQQAHACVDTIAQYKALAARGTLDTGADWFTCQCPKCFNSLGGTAKDLTCSAQCSASKCQNGVCAVDPAVTPSGGGGATPAGGGGKSSGGGMSGGMVFMVVFLTVGLTTAALYAVYHYVLRQRMEGEIRDIMSQYMPLGPQGGSRPRGGGRGSSLATVSEDDNEDAEDRPLIGGHVPTPTPAAAARAGGLGGRSAGSFRPPEPLQPQRSAYGGLVPSPTQDKPSGGYQPPAPVPEDDADVSGLTFGSTTKADEPADAGRPAASRQGSQAPLGDAPLLGDGPL